MMAMIGDSEISVEVSMLTSEPRPVLVQSSMSKQVCQLNTTLWWEQLEKWFCLVASCHFWSLLVMKITLQNL